MSHGHASWIAEAIAGRNLRLEAELDALRRTLDEVGQALVDVTILSGADLSDWGYDQPSVATDEHFRRHLLANPHEVVEDVQELRDAYDEALSETPTSGTKREEAA